MHLHDRARSEPRADLSCGRANGEVRPRDQLALDDVHARCLRIDGGQEHVRIVQASLTRERANLLDEQRLLGRESRTVDGEHRPALTRERVLKQGGSSAAVPAGGDDEAWGRRRQGGPHLPGTVEVHGRRLPPERER